MSLTSPILACPKSGGTRSKRIMHRPLTMAFWGFWPGFSPENNIFYKTLNLQYDIKIVNPFFVKPDIIITTFFAGPWHSRLKTIRFIKPARLKILFSGEPYLTGFDKFDATISTLDFPSSTNIYLPQWFHIIDWFGDADTALNVDMQRFGRAIKPDELLRPLKFRNRKFKFSMIYKNNHYLRSAFIQHLDLISTNALIVGPNQRVDKKMTALSDASSNFCFENSVAHGYVTEKLIEAFCCGCYPIYYGAPLAKEVFTQDNILNLFEVEERGKIKEIVEDCLNTREIKPLLKVNPQMLFEKFRDDMFRLVENFI